MRRFVRWLAIASFAVAGPALAQSTLASSGSGVTAGSSLNSLAVVDAGRVNADLLKAGIIDAGAYCLPDGGCIANTRPGAYWQTVHDCDFATQADVTLADDAGYTLCGQSWTAMNVTQVNGDQMRITGGVLRIKPSSSSDWYNTTRNKPGIKRTVADLFGADVTYGTPLRGCLRVSAFNAAANYDKIQITFTSPNGVINVFGGGLAFTLSAPYTPTAFAVNAGAAGSFANVSNTAPYNTDDVVCVELPLGIGGGLVYVYSANWSASGSIWPTGANVHPAFKYMNANATNATIPIWASSGATLDTWIVTLGGTRAASGTNLTIDVANMLWQKRTGSW